MRVLVIGDTIVDVNVFAEAVGLALESPTLKGEFTDQRESLGGAANLARELTTLGARVTMITAALANTRICSSTRTLIWSTLIMRP